MPGLVALDVETTGLDSHHGARPFYTTICNEQDETTSWDWDVDPLTREVKVIKGDLLEIKQHLHDKDVVGQNLKFDITMLSQVDRWFFWWDWERTYDMLDAAHLLASNELKNQTVLVLKYLRVNLKPWEDALEKCVKECRSMVQQARLRIKRRNTRMVEQRSRDDEQDREAVIFDDLDAADWKQDEFLARWAIAEEGRGDMPSAKEKTWAFDFWLPKQIAKHLSYDADHRYWTANSNYSDRDSASCVPCWKQMRTLIEKRGYWAHYEERRKLFRVNFLMENRQLPINKERTAKVKDECRQESEELGNVCVNIARGMGHDLTLPKGGRNKSLDTFVFDVLKLPVIALTDKGKPAMDKDVMRDWLLTQTGKNLSFLKRLAGKRLRDTCVSYIEGYERFGLSLRIDRGSPLCGEVLIHSFPGMDGWFAVYVNLNRTGTQTLRWSSERPNCVDGDTEVLTKDGWIRIRDLKDGQDIAQYDANDGSITFATPSKVHRKHYKGEMLHIQTEQQIDLFVTPNHRCLLFDRKRGCKKNEVTADRFRDDYKHINAGTYVGGTEAISDDMVIWLCAVQADGHYRADGQGIKFSFSKTRKIERLKGCLNRLGVVYSIYKESDRKEGKPQTSFHIPHRNSVVAAVKERMPNKQFGPWLLNLDRQTLDKFADEIFFWDGDWTRKQSWTSKHLNNADWIQTLFALSNRWAMIASRVPTSSPDGTTLHHYVNIINRNYSMSTNHTVDRVPWSDMVYCVTVPTSYFLIRRNGKISVTGNSQNTGKEKEGNEGRSLRALFGPGPGREWWSLDAKNIELRVPAYESGERLLIDLFERMKEPPFYGSEHLLNFSVIYPDIWDDAVKRVSIEKAGPWCKTTYKATWYQWVKNLDFALQYNCGKATAERAAHRFGVYSLLKKSFPKKEALNQKCIQESNTRGYVETIPRKSIDPLKGYPIACYRVSPTIPLAYHVSSTAMDWTATNMWKTQARLDEWRDDDGFDGHIAIQQHDELVFDFPRAGDPMKSGKNSNRDRIEELKSVMEETGDDFVIRIPTPVGVGYSVDDWGSEVVLY